MVSARPAAAVVAATVLVCAVLVCTALGSSGTSATTAAAAAAPSAVVCTMSAAMPANFRAVSALRAPHVASTGSLRVALQACADTMHVQREGDEDSHVVKLQDTEFRSASPRFTYTNDRMTVTLDVVCDEHPAPQPMRILEATQTMVRASLSSPDACSLHPAIKTFMGKHVPMARKRVLRSAPAYVDVNLGVMSSGGMAYGYTGVVTVGAPPVKYTLQLDTGSSTMAIMNMRASSTLDTDVSPSSLACIGWVSDCTNPARVPPPQGECGLFVCYGDNSGFNANWVSDEFSLGGFNTSLAGGPFARIDHTFKQSSGGDFEPPGVDGIMGLAYPALNYGVQSPVDAIFASYKNVPQQLGFCMTERGGLLTLGGVDPTLVQGNILWAPLVQSLGFDSSPYTYYGVAMLDILIDGKSIGVPSSHYFDQSGGSYSGQRSTLIDSGTTALCVDTTTFNAMVAAFNAIDSTNPTMSFVFAQDAALNPLPAISFSHSQAEWAKLFSIGYISSGCQYPIMGDTFMKNFFVVFDYDQHRVGFASLANTQCVSSDPNYVNSNPYTSENAASSVSLALASLVAALAVAALL